MSFATRAVSTANRLITKYGSYVTLIHSYNCTYDPSLGEQVCTTDTFQYKGAISAFTVAQSDLSIVNNGDLSVLIETDKLITKEWQVSYGGTTWEIIDIVKTVAQDITIVQRLQIRALA